MTGALPTFLIIGAMKCGTSALHKMLGGHPQIAVSAPKELNFFYGTDPPPSWAPDPWAGGNRWRGLDWYRSQFPADAPARGEASPGYTSPSHPDVAQRVAELLPDVRLLYLVRDPIARAVSQHHHHRRDGSERRALADALLDPASQYLARSRYHERLRPFLDRFPGRQLLIVATEDLRRDPVGTVSGVLRFLDADPPRLPSEQAPAPARVVRRRLDPALREQLVELLRDDADEMRRLAGRSFAGWSV